MFEDEDNPIFTASLLTFVKPFFLPNDDRYEYSFDMKTGKLRNNYLRKDFGEIRLEDKIVLDFNIKNTPFNLIKNCIKRICTRPVDFEKFDMVNCLRSKEPGVIITKEELDNQFLVYYPMSGSRQWEHAINLEFMFKPVRLSNASNRQ